MRRVTKENLIVQIDRLRKIKDEQGQLSMSGEYTLQAYEILLATMGSEPDERYQQLSDLYHAQEKRLFKIAQRIKGPTFDKYSHSPSQAIDVMEAAIFGEDESCRAAMLRGKVDGTLMNEGTTPVAQIKPVADLYGISVPGGRRTTYSTDAAEASDFRAMGWSVQEYVKLERYQSDMLNQK